MHEPSQAILVWPAVGIGVITACVWGYSIIPGLYLAQLLISVYLSSTPLKEFTTQSLIITHFFILADMIRCYLGAFLVKYFVGYPNALISNKSIFNFFIVAGPLNTFISTFIYSLIKFYHGSLDTLFINKHFLDWWFGDLLGFVIFAPLTMTLICQPKTIWQSRRLSFGLPVLIIFIAVIFIYNRTQKIENLNVNQNLKFKSELIASKLKERVNWVDSFYEDTRIHFTQLSKSNKEIRRYFNSINNKVDAIVWSFNGGYKNTVASDEFNRIKYVKLKQIDFESQFKNIPIEKNKISKSIYIEKINSIVNYLYIEHKSHSLKIYIINDTSDFLTKLLQSYELSNISVQLQFENSNQIIPLNSFVGDSNSIAETHESITTKFNYINENWLLLFQPTKKYLAQYQVQSNSVIAKISLLFTGLIGIMLLVITGKATLTDIEVKERTLELDIQSNKIKESKEQYQKLIEQHPVILWRQNINDNTMIYISNKVEKLYGFPHKFWLRKSNFWLNTIHPDDRANVVNAIEQAIEDKQHFELEYRLIKSDKSIAWINDVINVIVENDKVIEFVGLMIDVSETIEAKEKQDISESKYRILFKNAIDPLIIIDPISKTFLDANDKAQSLFNLPKDISHLKLIDFAPSKQLDGSYSDRLLFKFFNNAKLNDFVTFILQLVNGQGDAITCEIHLIKLPSDNREIILASINDITEKRMHEKRINRLAFYDNLTNLPNREYFYSKFEFFLKKANSLKQFGTIIYLDLDRFKILNDSLGHQAGDKLLKMVAKRIHRVTQKNDFSARLGGDEFIILTKNFDADEETALETSLVKSELILEALNEPYFIGDYEHLITPSIGISLFPSGDSTIDDIIHQADVAMYSSKEKGKNTITIYQDNMDRLVSHRLKFEKAIRLAFENNEFELYYQPQVNENGEIEAVEALLRWEKLRSFNKNIEELIEAIEEIGLTHELRHLVFEKACSQLKAWQDQERPVKSVAINVTAKQFHQNFFIEQVRTVVESYHLKPSQIVLELTEQAIIEDVNGMINKLTLLKEYGIRTSLDDFGTGYSSLAYLKQLPIDQLKIDKMFIKDVTENESSHHIVKTIINLAQLMQIELVAEGIETNVHYEVLKNLGCKQFQGYYFSRPLPSDKLFNDKK